MNKKTILLMSLILMTTPLLGCLGGDTGGGGDNGDGDQDLASCEDGPTPHDEIMGDPAVRVALSYLLDYETVHADVYNGYSAPLPGPIPQGFPHYDTQNNGEPLFEYNPTKAAQILEDAGYLQDSNGEYFCGATLQIYYNQGNTEREQMSRLYQQDLQDFGISSEVTGENWPQYLERMFGGTDWDIMFLGWAPDYVDPDNYWYNFAHSSVDVYNTNYQNEELDALLDDARFAQTPAERDQAYADAYDLYMQEPNLIYVGQATTAITYRSWVQGLEYNPVKYPYFADYSKADGAKNPDTFVYQTFGDAKNLDPADAWDSASNDVQRQVYEGLVTYEGDNAKDLQPSLATSWEWSDDGSSITFQLREGVTYHNGNTFDATDVEMHFKRVITYDSPDSGVAHLISDFVNASGVERVDDTTVTFHLENPSPAFLPAIAYSVGYITDWETCEANGGMPSPNATGAYPDEASRGCSAYFRDHAVGTGPYELESWEPGSETTFVRNDDYWGDAPDLSRAVIQKVDEANSRILSLQNGDADLITTPTERVEELKGESGITVIEEPTFTVTLGLFQTESTVEG